MRQGLIEKTYEWDLSAAPSQLWPLLSDTARLNEALDLPRYSISETFDSESLRRRYGEMVEDEKRVRWEEPPFEWVENGWWRWRRFYDHGPLRETGGVLMFMPAESGRTHMHYTKGRVRRRNSSPNLHNGWRLRPLPIALTCDRSGSLDP